MFFDAGSNDASTFQRSNVHRVDSEDGSVTKQTIGDTAVDMIVHVIQAPFKAVGKLFGGLFK
jgi:hypothetical protein